MSNVDVLTQIKQGAGLEALDGIEIHLPSGTVVTRIGLRVSLYFQHGDTLARREAGLRVMRSFYDVFEPFITHWLPVSGGRKRTVKPGVYPPMEQPKALNDLDEHFGGVLYGYREGQDTEEPAPFLVYLTCLRNKNPSRNSYLQAHIPLSWAVQHGFAAVRDLVAEWSGELEAVHGVTGIALLFDGPNGSSYLSYSYFLLKKFPGLDYENSPTFNTQVNSPHTGGVKPYKIRTSSWLTVLGDHIIAELGGRENIRAQLGPECSIFNYRGGIVIQAMPVPELGSTEDGIFPEGYRKVARLTRPVRFDGYRTGLFQGLPNALDDHEETLNWLRRFDD